MNNFAPFGGNYPAMTSSQWANAPFNQPDEPEYKEVTITAEYTITREDFLEIDEADLDCNGCYTGKDLENVYNENFITPAQIFAEYIAMMTEKLETESHKGRRAEIKRKIAGAKNYKIELTDVYTHE